MCEGRRFALFLVTFWAVLKPVHPLRPGRMAALVICSFLASVVGPGVSSAAAQNENYGTQNISVRTLLDQGREQFVAGQSEAAALTVERALRIEPDNPVLWHQIARIRYQMKAWDEAYNLSQRSIVLAGDNYKILPKRNRNLQAAIERARQGDHQTLAQIDAMLVVGDSTAIEISSISDSAQSTGEEVLIDAKPDEAPRDRSRIVNVELQGAENLEDLTRLQRSQAPDPQQQVRTESVRVQQRRVQPRRVQPRTVAPISEPIFKRSTDRRSSGSIANESGRVNTDSVARRGSEVVERSFGVTKRGLNQGIPQAALPAPGYCRVWFDNRALESQPPIMLCEQIGDTIPSGARLIVGRYR